MYHSFIIIIIIIIIKTLMYAKNIIVVGRMCHISLV